MRMLRKLATPLTFLLLCLLGLEASNHDNDEGRPLTEEDFENADSIPEKPINGDPLTNQNRFEGDIDLNHHPLRAYTQEAPGENPNTMRNAVRSPFRKWDDARIPIVVSSSFSDYERSRIAAAVKEFEKYTCVKFEPRKSQQDYVYVHKGDGCYSLVGKHGGRQPLSIGNGCAAKGIIMHELMHTSGFFHEQSRADRDEYIDIDYDNVIPNAVDQFQKYSLRTVDHLGTPYDYASIMHYGAFAFSRNKQRTVVPKRRGATIGQRKGFSRNDVVKLNKLYDCEQAATPRPARTPAARPRPTLATRAPPAQQTRCADTRSDCQRFLHKCNTEKGAQYCSKTCNLCSNSGDDCVDKLSDETCKRLQRDNFCRTGPLYYITRKQCCKTCQSENFRDTATGKGPDWD